MNFSRTRIKMCGMTRVEDVVSACEAGADAIGLVFYPPSPRAVSLAQAKELSEKITTFVNKTVLFVNADVGYIHEVLAETKADVIQFHGDESEAFCQQFGMPYIKALRVKNRDQLEAQLAEHAQAPSIMLDAFVPGVPGGTGQSFDWSLIPLSLRSRLFLAGGLDSANVETAVSLVRPYAVDVSGGIEISKGIKSAEKIHAFAAKVRQADRLVSEISS